MSPRRFLQSDTGSGAAEFAMVLPVLMFLLFGSMNLIFMVYAQANLHSATEAAARNASVSFAATGVAPTQNSVNTYGATQYKGPRINVTFTYPNVDVGVVGCGASSAGYKVKGSGTYALNYGFGHLSVPLHTAACFP